MSLYIPALPLTGWVAVCNVLNSELLVLLREGSWDPLHGAFVGINKIAERKPLIHGSALGRSLLVGLVFLTSCPLGSQAGERRHYN